MARTARQGVAMTPTVLTDVNQRADQTWSGGVLVDEVVHAWPEDGTAVHRWENASGIHTASLSGLPIPVPEVPYPSDQLSAVKAIISSNVDPVTLGDVRDLLAKMVTALGGV